MEKAIKIQIGNDFFHIEESAYRKLHSYLDKLNDYYSNIEDGKEIVSDIELRIAEILKERGRSEDNVIRTADVEYIISVLGSPEQITEDDRDESYKYQRYRCGKRLFRNPDDMYLGGVSGGLAAYFGISSIIVRLLFVIAVVAFGTGTIAYIVLWIVMPLARTRAEKLEMRGRKVTIDNIDQSIRDEYESMKESFSKFKSSDFYKNMEDTGSKIGNKFKGWFSGRKKKTYKQY